MSTNTENKKSANHFINSAVATAVAEIITLPVCTTKTRYQNTDSKSIVTTARHIYATQGVRGFYSATAPALGVQMFSTSSKYAMYKYFERNGGIPLIPKEWQNRFLYGTVSGLITSLITHPVDNVRIHMQMNTSFLQQLRIVGPYLFYRGYSKTWCKMMVAASLYLPLYDWSSELTDNIQGRAVISATLSTLATHPFDYLKTRHTYGLSVFQGYNPLNYYRGVHVNLLRIIPHFTIMMTGIEWLNRLD